MRHILSLIRAPIGYVCNLIATLTSYMPFQVYWLDRVVCALCETFCVDDGVQTDPLF